MPNGTLEDHLQKLVTPLYWAQRLKICIGTARGLDYLHTGTGIEFGVIHRDVKSSNILLDDNWAAKISDFGLSKIGATNKPSTYVKTLVKGNFGYLDPNYFTTGMLTRKSDLFSFGVVLLEVLCLKRAVDGSLDEEQWGLVPWAQESIKEGNLKNIIDSVCGVGFLKLKLKQHLNFNVKLTYFGLAKFYPNIDEFDEMKEATIISEWCLFETLTSQRASVSDFGFTSLATRCVAEDPEARPSREEILKRLEQIYSNNK
ncbi:probable receptor-like protein kinase At2g39360 [Lactuca sativa]|uniref:probable receptor-like protein kinase At2g39360 n=1 Tax=Lactuca sativa TaxID=4236 RepID=UPI0022AF4B40|nr:probable receptor-like protein kinase At2g39360 [Lactuca sativa]